MRLFVDQLTNIDSSYLDPERGVVGETWVVDVELGGELDQHGMVFDFGHVKKRIKAVIDEVADHRLIVPARNTAVSGEAGHWRMTLTDGQHIEHLGPAESVCVLPAPAVTADALADFLLEHVQDVLPDNVEQVRLSLYHEAMPQGQSFYHYTHGLKHHDGNCQRIAHGHRSQIRVMRNGQRDHHLERKIADHWRDIYLVTREDIIGHESGQLVCAYRAAQGEFRLSLPEQHCDILETDSTVELIADHLASQLAHQHPGDDIEVRAYEGLNKGAISQLRIDP